MGPYWRIQAGKTTLNWCACFLPSAFEDKANPLGGGLVIELVAIDLGEIAELMDVPESEPATERKETPVNVEANLGETPRFRDPSTRIKKSSVRLVGYGK